MLWISEQRVGKRDFAQSIFFSTQVFLRCQTLSSTNRIGWRDIQWLMSAGATDLVQ